MKLKDWRAAGDYFEYQNLPVFYRANRKSGEVVLCLHGFPTSSHDYHKIWDALGERFAVVAFDLIGYGSSAKPFDFNYTTFAQADVFEALMAHLEIEKVHILAHDFGNTITLELLARAEEDKLGFSVESVCLLNGALFPETHRPILAQKILISPLGALFGRFAPDWLFKRGLASIFGAETQPTAAELQDFVEAFKFKDGRRIAHKLIRYTTERRTHRARWLGALERFSSPLRLINGSADPVSGKHLVERFRELFPQHADIIEIERIGHFPHFETPALTAELFFEFHGAKS